MKLAADELLTAGVNAIVYHGFPYTIPEFPLPGWHPFTGVPPGGGNYSSFFNERNPFWPYFARLNAYITRVQFISQAEPTLPQLRSIGTTSCMARKKRRPHQS